MQNKVFASPNYHYSGNSSLQYSQYDYYNPAVDRQFRWTKFPVKIYIGNVPSEYREIVKNSIKYWGNYFPFEISNDPKSDVDIVWVSNLSGTDTNFKNPYALTSNRIDNNYHKCLIKVRNRKFAKTELNEIMLHELGHVAGLGESSYPDDIMYQIPKASDGKITSWTFMSIGYIPLILPSGYKSEVAGKSSLSQRDLHTLARIYSNSPNDNEYMGNNNINQSPNNRGDCNISKLFQQDCSTQNSISDYINKGNSFYHTHDYNKALESYKKALDVNPNNPTVNGNIGLCYLAQGKYDLAIDYTNKAISINPNREDYYVDLGLSYKGKDLYDKAIENYKKAIAVNPSCTNAYVNLGSIYVDTGEYDLAIINCQKAIDIKPNCELAYVNMGVAYENKGEYHKALALFEKALSINPNSTLAKNNYNSLNHYILNVQK